MTWSISGVIRVLLVPPDSGQPMRLMDVDSARFERALGGPVTRVRALADPPLVSWQAFVNAAAQEAAVAPNYRAKRLATAIGGQPGRTMYGPVVFTGRGPQNQVKGLPGIVNQMAGLIGHVSHA
jgi:hypothetical protein